MLVDVSEAGKKLDRLYIFDRNGYHFIKNKNSKTRFHCLDAEYDESAEENQQKLRSVQFDSSCLELFEMKKLTMF